MNDHCAATSTARRTGAWRRSPLSGHHHAPHFRSLFAGLAPADSRFTSSALSAGACRARAQACLVAVAGIAVLAYLAALVLALVN